MQRRGAGPAPRSDVSHEPDDHQGHISDSDRADLAFARAKRTEHEHRVWLWTLIKGGAKWMAVVAGGGLVLLNTVKAVLGAIRDGL